MTTTERPDWPQRAMLLAALGAVAGFVFEALNDRFSAIEEVRRSLAIFVALSAGLFAFTLERRRWIWSLGFALVAAALVALIHWFSGSTREWDKDWDAGAGWRLAAAFLSVAIAAPLFQTARDATNEGGRVRFPYPEVHGHAWTNVVLFFAAWAFAGVATLLGFLIAELFELIGITALGTLMDKEWFVALLVGAALGGAIGLLRERERVVRTMLSIVLVVLRVLAPVLAVFLAAFLVFLPFTGLSTLWEATRSTTPIVLGCAIVASILINAVVGQDDGDTAHSRILRLAARILSFTLLPLALIAAVSLGLRIAQHGLSVERLWALAFVAVATAYGLAYLVSVRRGDWVARLRQTNLRLAFALCGLALFLALPILSFPRIATNDQVARLQDGRTAPEKFDWVALRFDFGAPGEAAVERLAKGGTSTVRAAATRALAARDRYDLRDEQRVRVAAEGIERRLRVISAPSPVDAAVRDAVVRDGSCGAGARCALIVESATAAVLVHQRGADVAPAVTRYAYRDGRWASDYSRAEDNAIDGSMQALADGRVEIRDVTRRQVFVGGRPVGDVFGQGPDAGSPAAVEVPRPMR